MPCPQPDLHSTRIKRHRCAPPRPCWLAGPSTGDACAGLTPLPQTVGFTSIDSRQEVAFNVWTEISCNDGEWHPAACKARGAVVWEKGGGRGVIRSILGQLDDWLRGWAFACPRHSLLCGCWHECSVLRRNQADIWGGRGKLEDTRAHAPRPSRHRVTQSLCFRRDRLVISQSTSRLAASSLPDTQLPGAQIDPSSRPGRMMSVS